MYNLSGTSRLIFCVMHVQWKRIPSQWLRTGVFSMILVIGSPPPFKMMNHSRVSRTSGGVELSFPGFCKVAACVNLGVTLKGWRGVENAAVAVEESCVLDVKSGTVLVISSGRVLEFNCSLKVRYLFRNWKYLLAFSSSQRSFRESKSSMLPCISCIAGRSGTDERFCCFRYFKSSWGILKPCFVKTFFTRQEVCSHSTSILGSSFRINQQITKRSFYSLFLLI